LYPPIRSVVSLPLKKRFQHHAEATAAPLQ
jgi:hypothetical protein